MESLTCDLFLPGMTPLHRAGLGGLVSTLRKLEKKPERPPGIWEIHDRSVRFQWRDEQEREQFCQQLFQYAYQLRDEMIYLPGQYDEDLAPPLEIRAALQEGLLLSFYDHGPQSRGKSGNAHESSYEVDDKPITYRHLPLAWYKHQRDGAALLLEAIEGKMEITRMLLPGATERHAGSKGTSITQDASLALPLLFAPVGVLALKAGGKRVNASGKRKFKPGAAVLIPDIHNLAQVHYWLPALIPKSARDCQVGNAQDAALQAEIRLRSRNLLDPEIIPSIRCLWCCPNDWNSRLQPPSLVTEISVSALDPKLDQFEIAMQALPPPEPRLNKKTGQYFWPKSIARPFVAENLASGKPWYQGFTRLMTAQDPTNNQPIRDHLNFERGGLHVMTQEIPWDRSGEEAIVHAVHEALRCRYGRIAEENKGNPVAMKNRMSREYERLRLALAGAKTADALRNALTDLWSRAGPNDVLKKMWPQILPMLANNRWQLARDLALLALPSYQGKGQEQEQLDLVGSDETENLEETEEDENE
jgi:CRISPR-associated protein Cas8a1/Csx13